MPGPETPDRLFHVSSVTPRCRILVLGLGGAGCNTVARMSETWKQGPPVIAMNTDSQALSACTAQRCIPIGKETTHGLGAAGEVMVGRLAAEESLEAIQELLASVDLLFLVTGLGGGTGTGAGPVVVDAARKLGILTLCFVTMPFPFEGDRRRRVAEEGLKSLQKVADVVVCLPNARLIEVVDQQAGVEEAFRTADEMLGKGIHGLWRLLSQAGVINLDFADVRTLAERSGGVCAYAYSEATGSARGSVVLQQLLENPLLEKGRLLAEASGVLVNITGGPDLTLADMQGLTGQIQSMVRPGCHFFFGAIIDPAFRDRISVTVLVSENWLENKRAAAPKTKGSEPAEPLLDGIATAVPRSGKASGEQGELVFERFDKDRFKGVEPTVYKGEDLDIPTFMRRGVRLSFEH